MKLLSADIVNFKSLSHLHLDFQSSSGAPRNLTCLVGDNGAGKTTVLQAIALVLSLATRRTHVAYAFDWHGFLAERIGSMGRTRVELQIALTDAEVELTSSLFCTWYDSLAPDWRESHHIVEPSDHRIVTLVYEQNRLSSPQGDPGRQPILGAVLRQGVKPSRSGLAPPLPRPGRCLLV